MPFTENVPMYCLVFILTLIISQGGDLPGVQWLGLLSLQRAKAPSLVGELRSYKPCSMAKKKIFKKKKSSREARILIPSTQMRGRRPEVTQQMRSRMRTKMGQPPIKGGPSLPLARQGPSREPALGCVHHVDRVQIQKHSNKLYF